MFGTTSWTTNGLKSSGWPCVWKYHQHNDTKNSVNPCPAAGSTMWGTLKWHSLAGTAASWKGTHLFSPCPRLCNVHAYGFIMKYNIWERQQWCSPYSSCMNNSQLLGHQWGKESSWLVLAVWLQVRLTVHLPRKKVIHAAHWIKS